MKNNPASDPLLDLPIDQYSRQQWARLFVETLRPSTTKQHLKVLDVGGYKGKTKEFFPTDNVVVCDLFDVKEPGYVKGDGRSLPFADNEFDFVVSFDTYEHVTRAGRKQFMKELIRVARVGVILAAPFDNPTHEVLEAEKSLNRYYQDLYDKEHPWLPEHIAYQTPQQAEIESLLRSLKTDFVSLPSNDLGLWTVIQSVYFSIELDEDLRGRVDDINRFYNRHLPEVDGTNGTSYRRIYYISNDQRDLSVISKFTAKNKPSDQVRNQCMALVMSIFGKKYRDIARHRDYLDAEVANYKQQNAEIRENLESVIAALQQELDKPLRRKLLERLKKYAHR